MMKFFEFISCIVIVLCFPMSVALAEAADSNLSNNTEVLEAANEGEQVSLSGTSKNAEVSEANQAEVLTNKGEEDQPSRTPNNTEVPEANETEVLANDGEKFPLSETSKNPKAPEGNQSEILANKAEGNKHSGDLVLFVPRLAPDSTNSSFDYQEVILSGMAQPNENVNRGSGTVSLIFSNNSIKEIAWDEVLITPLPFKTNEEGYFELKMKLPSGTVQFSLESLTRRVVVVVDVSESGIALKGGKALKKNPYTDSENLVWAGGGANYVIYGQELPVQAGNTRAIDVEFDSFSYPSYFLKVEKQLKRHWSANVALKSSPGSTSSSLNFTVNRGDYIWWILSGEGVKYPKKLQRKIGNNFYQFGFNFGFQYHKVPFLNKVSTTTFDIDSNFVTMLSGGGNLLINQHKRLYFEIFMRGVLPFASGSLFDITPQLAFDGSTGAIYKYNKKWRMGIFWYGAYQSYDFNVSSNNLHGSQNLFFSNFEFRAGYVF